MILAFPIATSGLISGSGLAMAKMMGSGFMLSTCSMVSTSGTESPRKRSVPATASERSPVLPSGFVFSANHRLDSFRSSRWFAENTNPEGRTGDLSDAVAGTDLFLGLSVPDVLTIEHVESMNPDPIIFAMANPDPEIRPEVAMGKARIIATGRSDYPNQINNVLCFPGIFRGALDVRAREIDEPMKLAAAEAIAGVIPAEDLSEDYIIPSVFDERVAPAVAEAVANRAKETGMARRIQERAETGLTATSF